MFDQAVPHHADIRQGFQQRQRNAHQTHRPVTHGGADVAQAQPVIAFGHAVAQFVNIRLRGFGLHPLADRLCQIAHVQKSELGLRRAQPGQYAAQQAVEQRFQLFIARPVNRRWAENPQRDIAGGGDELLLGGLF